MSTTADQPHLLGSEKAHSNGSLGAVVNQHPGDLEQSRDAGTVVVSSRAVFHRIVVSTHFDDGGRIDQPLDLDDEIDLLDTAPGSHRFSLDLVPQLHETLLQILDSALGFFAITGITRTKRHQRSQLLLATLRGYRRDDRGDCLTGCGRNCTTYQGNDRQQ